MYVIQVFIGKYGKYQKKMFTYWIIRTVIVRNASITEAIILKKFNCQNCNEINEIVMKYGVMLLLFILIQS